MERAQDRKEHYRTVRIDKEYFPITDDYRPDRLNFEIDQGKVTKADKY